MNQITLLHYAERYAKFQTNDYKNLLKTSPSVELAELMLTTKLPSRHGTYVLNLSSVASILMGNGHKAMLVEVLKNLHNYKKDTLTQLTNKISLDYLDDNHMNSDRWLEVVELCEKDGLIDVGVDILSAVISK